MRQPDPRPLRWGRRERQPTRENIFRDGDEYWATVALYLPADFPDNDRWAPPVQRKFQNTMPPGYPSWFTLNVHRTIVDVTLPGGQSWRTLQLYERWTPMRDRMRDFLTGHDADRLVPHLYGLERLCPRLCPPDGRKRVDFLSIFMKADFQKPSPAELSNRNRASAVFTYTYRLR